jgi:4-oxalocrotonate tautomerase family enzyme
LPYVTIRWFKGRNYETKKKVMKLVTNAVVEGCGCSSEDVSVIFLDVDKNDWGSGGVPYSEK